MNSGLLPCALSLFLAGATLRTLSTAPHRRRLGAWSMAWGPCLALLTLPGWNLSLALLLGLLVLSREGGKGLAR